MTLLQTTLRGVICSSIVGAYQKNALPSNYHEEKTNSIWQHLQLQTSTSGLELSKMQIPIPAYWWTFAWYFTHFSSKFQSTYSNVRQGGDSLSTYECEKKKCNHVCKHSYSLNCGEHASIIVFQINIQLLRPVKEMQEFVYASTSLPSLISSQKAPF